MQLLAGPAHYSELQRSRLEHVPPMPSTLQGRCQDCLWPLWARTGTLAFTAASAVQQQPSIFAKMLFACEIGAYCVAGSIQAVIGAEQKALGDVDKLRALFPNSFGQPSVQLQAAQHQNGSAHGRALKVAIVLSGGQAPGEQLLPSTWVLICASSSAAPQHTRSALVHLCTPHHICCLETCCTLVAGSFFPL